MKKVILLLITSFLFAEDKTIEILKQYDIKERKDVKIITASIKEYKKQKKENKTNN